MMVMLKIILSLCILLAAEASAQTKPVKLDTASLAISTIGYKAKTLELGNGSLYSEVDTAAVMAELLKPIRCLAAPRLPNSEKVKRFINDHTPEWMKRVQISSKQLRRGDSLHLTLTLPKQGDYTMEVQSSYGYSILTLPLSMETKVQKFTIPTDIYWWRDTLWLRIINDKTKRTYRNKILLK
jgi:hypothetical protein